MQTYGKRLLFSCLALSATALFSPKAEAHHTRHKAHTRTVRAMHMARNTHHARVIQCVAFVHQSTDFKIHGNARDWWARAKGLYARGNKPEIGSVLSFKPIHHMPLGHVAVVRSLVDHRTIMIDQSHWGTNGISRNVRVVDVSPRNDWTAVRVALRGNPDRLGSVYPSHGFIYHRPEGTAAAYNESIDVLGRDTNLLKTNVNSQPFDEIFNDDASHHSIL